MDGFSNRDKNIYFNIFNGKICRKVPLGTEGSIERVNKLGNTVSEVFYDSFTGLLVNIRLQPDGGYGKQWAFDFKTEGGSICTLQLGVSNGFATALIKVLPNIDLDKVITITPNIGEYNGKQTSTLFVNQDGKALKHAFTREVPNSMPDLEKKIISGKEVWDDTERLNFFEKLIMESIVPELKKRNHGETHTAQNESFGGVDLVSSDTQSDDSLSVDDLGL